MTETRKRKLLEITDYELANKFRSKKDFYTYLSDNCKYQTTANAFLIVQYYLPPTENVTKDFLRSVFTEEKKLMKMGDVVNINVPLYQELNVADVLEVFKDHEELKRHLPDRLAKGRQIDRTYFFTVLNTLEPEKLQQMIAHA